MWLAGSDLSLASLGARWRVESTPNPGTRFEFELTASTGRSIVG